MAVFISVVSHGHASLVESLGTLKRLINSFNVIVKSNKPGDDFSVLNESQNFHWLDCEYFCGFGENNNIVFKYCQTELSMKDDDIFIALNPDVDINETAIVSLIELMSQNHSAICTINLYKDTNLSEFDNSIRRFPSFTQFIKSFLGFGNTSIIDKSAISKPCKVDWAAGSFLAFGAYHYQTLGGFDERYFMYCEDIDICWRSKELGMKVDYFPNIKAQHLAKHENRKLLSKHFYWHVTSVMKFLLKKLGLGHARSRIYPE
ncbi:glycosyltransferase family 2 protein [Photobacterium sanguinicancri]|uniref:glycosyltransferase family 2 protein n=1 Tax=Photobacterium sanguinicancri TaxID=875932 RepID=UPI0026E49523|nr:glycosyltransferase family 2 protein [Photobacterium sanguinicancri]MDO6499524.1 glycosyltransferase family 2 protein [Photobacterium sanguinicancri]